jgi:hypothetical protein
MCGAESNDQRAVGTALLQSQENDGDDMMDIGFHSSDQYFLSG